MSGWGFAIPLRARYAAVDGKPAESTRREPPGCIDCGGPLVGENPFYCRADRPTHVWGKE